MMQHWYDRYDIVSNDLEEDSGGAILRRLERLEYLTRDVLPPIQHAVRPEGQRLVTTGETARPRPEHILWQGSPAFFAYAPGLVWAGIWTGLWFLVFLHRHAIAAHLDQWYRPVQVWLRQIDAVELARWYSQGAVWLIGHMRSEVTSTVVPLLLTLGSLTLLLSRFLQAMSTSYCLTPQRLTAQQRGRRDEIVLPQLVAVRVRRPFWGRLLGYVHVRFSGHNLAQHRVRWWGVPERSLLTALLQATLHNTWTGTPR